MLVVEYFIACFILCPKEGKVDPILPVVILLFQVIFATMESGSRLAGVGVETVRFSERGGFLDQPTRPDSGSRHYPRDVIKRIQFLRRAGGKRIFPGKRSMNCSRMPCGADIDLR